jgi:hypothetical protein
MNAFQNTPDDALPGPAIFFAAGQSGIVSWLDSDQVLKQYTESEDRVLERRAYERLGRHPYLARYFGPTLDGSIVLKRGECLRSALRRIDANKISAREELCLAQETAGGLSLHPPPRYHSR